MKKRNILLTLLAVAGMLTATSCKDYLDEMPLNRAELDSESKIISLLVSALSGKRLYLLYRTGNRQRR